jgi:hypothetical protein
MQSPAGDRGGGEGVRKREAYAEEKEEALNPRICKHSADGVECEEERHAHTHTLSLSLSQYIYTHTHRIDAVECEEEKKDPAGERDCFFRNARR